MKIEFTAIFQKVPEGYIAFVEELPGANTQGETLEEARANLYEAIQMVLEANRELAEDRYTQIFGLSRFATRRVASY
ncbi:MAG: type II toxin-antitoxin system HicB family antitoxin [Candidatus Methylumidiphilus sp.]